jgi:hypothetical protein
MRPADWKYFEDSNSPETVVPCGDTRILVRFYSATTATAYIGTWSNSSHEFRRRPVDALRVRGKGYTGGVEFARSDSGEWHAVAGGARVTCVEQPWSSASDSALRKAVEVANEALQRALEAEPDVLERAAEWRAEVELRSNLRAIHLLQVKIAEAQRMIDDRVATLPVDIRRKLDLSLEGIEPEI